MDLAEKDDFDKFNINEEFAKRFEHNKRREILQKGQQKYGKLLTGDNMESSSSSDDEDSEGELINQTVEKKFIEVLAAIRTNDPKLKQIAEDDCIFKDEDFQEKEVKTQKKDKGMTLKDQIRERALKKLDKEEDESSQESSDSENESVQEKRAPKAESKLFEKIGVPLNEQQQKIKEEFKKEAFAGDESSEDDFLVKKKKPVQSDTDNEIE